MPAAAEEPTLRVGMIPNVGTTLMSIEGKAPLRDYKGYKLLQSK